MPQLDFQQTVCTVGRLHLESFTKYTGWLKIKYPTGEYEISPQPVV